MGRPEAEVSLLLVDDAEMRRLNRTWRGLDRTTDVLSFSQVEGEGMPDGGGALLGDVVISLERARDQASLLGVSYGSELSRLLAHGILHLAGYDHEGSRRDAAFMRREEERWAREMA